MEPPFFSFGKMVPPKSLRMMSPGRVVFVGIVSVSPDWTTSSAPAGMVKSSVGATFPPRMRPISMLSRSTWKNRPFQLPFWLWSEMVVAKMTALPWPLPAVENVPVFVQLAPAPRSAAPGSLSR